MKGITWYVVGAIALAVLGGISPGWSRLDREIARAQEALITSDYDAAGSSLEVVDVEYIPIAMDAFRELRHERGVIGAIEDGAIDDSDTLILCFQSYILRTPRHVILVDSCIGNHKPRPARPMWDMACQTFWYLRHSRREPRRSG